MSFTSFGFFRSAGVARVDGVDGVSGFLGSRFAGLIGFRAARVHRV